MHVSWSDAFWSVFSWWNLETFTLKSCKLSAMDVFSWFIFYFFLSTPPLPLLPPSSPPTQPRRVWQWNPGHLHWIITKPAAAVSESFSVRDLAFEMISTVSRGKSAPFLLYFGLCLDSSRVVWSWSSWSDEGEEEQLQTGWKVNGTFLLFPSIRCLACKLTNRYRRRTGLEMF